jgi:hypothetical protein
MPSLIGLTEPCRAIPTVYVLLLNLPGARTDVPQQTPAWEPFLMMHDDQLVCYYSDQCDTANGQKLAHQTTADGKTWSAEVNDVAYSTYAARPEMAVVWKLLDG